MLELRGSRMEGRQAERMGGGEEENDRRSCEDGWVGDGWGRPNELLRREGRVAAHGMTAGMTPSMQAVSQTPAPPRPTTVLTSCSSLAMILVEDVTCNSATTGSMPCSLTKSAAGSLSGLVHGGTQRAMGKRFIFRLQGAPRVFTWLLLTHHPSITNSSHQPLHPHQYQHHNRRRFHDPLPNPNHRLHDHHNPHEVLLTTLVTNTSMATHTLSRTHSATSRLPRGPVA